MTNDDSYLAARVSFNEANWAIFLAKVDKLRENYSVEQGSYGFVRALCAEFISSTGVPRFAIASFYGLLKRNKTTFYANSISYRFVKWVLELPDDHKVSRNFTLKVLPGNQLATHDEGFESFVKSHQEEIQTIMLRAWKDAIAYYSPAVVLAALRNMGLDDNCFAVLSRATSN